MNEGFALRLREAREAKGLSRKELAQRAKVPLPVVKCLEEGRWSDLPEAVYVRWFVERLAQELDIPWEEWGPIVEGLAPRVDLSSVVIKKATPQEGWGWWQGFALFAFLVVLLGAFLWFGVGTYLGTSQKGLPRLKENGHRVQAPQEGEKGLAISQRLRRLVPPGMGVVSDEGRGEGTEAEAALVELHTLEIKAAGKCWVWMKLEDGAVRDFILRPGERYRISFTRKVEVRLGNPGAVALLLDGKDLGFEGKEGKPEDLKVTPSGIEVKNKVAR